MRKRSFILLAAALILWCAGIRVFALETPDLTQTGTISVTMKSEGAPVPGGSLTIYRVGDIQIDDGNCSFALTADFAASGVSLEENLNAAKAAKLADFAKKQKLTGVTETIGADGTVTFAVDPGLYLLVQTKAPKGYSPASPFLVSVPAMEDGSYVYDVDATPKVELEKVTAPTVPPTTKPKDPTLPQTGTAGGLLPLSLLGAGLLVCGCVMKKKDRHEA